MVRRCRRHGGHGRRGGHGGHGRRGGHGGHGRRGGHGGRGGLRFLGCRRDGFALARLRAGRSRGLDPGRRRRLRLRLRRGHEAGHGECQQA
ncbi:MAG: hypothetical protein FJ125_01850 [Deltaproteobacteria bacterium]|nr:hypothetical protein [Deltaproteobacteria bacterium]